MKQPMRVYFLTGDHVCENAKTLSNSHFLEQFIVSRACSCQRESALFLNIWTKYVLMTSKVVTMATVQRRKKDLPSHHF